jgi:phage gpG-like protein
LVLLRFTLVVDNVAVIDRAFSRFGDNVRDLRPVWDDVAKEFYRIEDEQFATEGAHSGNAWKPLSAKYEKWKESKIPAQMILEWDGTLKRSLTGPSSKGSIREETENELALGSSIHYARYHQQGTRKMPRRPPIDLNEGDKRRITKAIHRGLVKRNRRTGLESDENWVE